MTTSVGANYSQNGYFKIGVLIKRGGGTTKLGKSSWKKRFFKLSPTQLTYWSSDKNDAKCKGDISLVDYVWVQEQNVKKGNFLFLLKTTSRTWELVAATEAERAEWMAAIDTLGKVLKITKEIDTHKVSPPPNKLALMRCGDNFLRFASNVSSLVCALLTSR